MRIKFDAQLRLLGEEMTHMGSMIESAIQDATHAFLNQDVETAKRIMAEDEYIDQEQKKIENICFQLLIQQQPVARDLRTITAAMKMVTDMERIGDQAEDIAEILPFVQGRSWENSPLMERMAHEAGAMVTSSVDAYVKGDLSIAQKVIEDDDTVDGYFDQVKSRLIDRIAANPAEGEYALDLLMIAKYFERIADHAVNIAQWVIFSVTGEHKEG